MKRWPTKPLGDLVSLEYGKALKAEERSENGHYPVYGSNGIVGSFYEALVKDPTIVVGRKGAIGEAHLAQNGCWPIDTSFYTVVREPGTISLPFLLLWFRSVDLKTLAITSTIPGLNRTTLYSQKVPVPPLAEQGRIVKLLDEADELRKLRAQADRRTAALIPALFHEMFGGSKSSSFASMPLEEVCGEICRYPTYYGIEYVKTGVPEIRGELLTNDYSIEQSPEKFRFISQATSLHFPRTQLSEGDLVMSVRGTVGKLALVPKPLSGANITANLLRISPRKDLLNGEFLLHFLVDGGGISKVAAISTSTTILTLKVADLKKMHVPVPPLSLQKEFAQRVAEIRAMEAEQAASRRRLDDLFQSMLHRAFRGEL